MLTFLDKRVRRAFSNAAMQYDVLTGLHKEIGRELVDEVSKIQDTHPCSAILDVGMGTGWLTNRLKLFFPESRVIGVDFAHGMVAFAKKQNEGFQIIQADAARLPFQENTFDIVTSNLTYQWVGNLEEAFKRCHDCLNQQGVFCFTMFGYETFEELFSSLQQAVSRRMTRVTRLASREDVHKAMTQSGFQNIKIECEKITTHFPDMMSLIKWIKSIGANALSKDVYVGKDFLGKANNFYNQNFKSKLGIRTTFEVLWVRAEK